VNVQQVQQLLKTDPLADGSLPEIIIDNADAGNVKVTGNWKTKEHIGFGPSILVADTATADLRSVQFTPVISKAGYYKVYAYFLSNYTNATSQTNVFIFDGQTTTKAPIQKSAIQAQGQTSGEWVQLGRFKLPAGSTTHVTIDASNADGAVVADAILFVPDGDQE
jgi:hypothetical protein